MKFIELTEKYNILNEEIKSCEAMINTYLLKKEQLEKALIEFENKEYVEDLDAVN